MSSPSFEMTVLVLPSDIDEQNHVNNTVYLRWVQDVATAHWLAIASPEVQETIGWVVLRHEIDYKRPAYLGEELVVRTWLEGMTAATTERVCEIVRPADGLLLAKARTIWCAVDPATGRPKRVSSQVRAAFASAD